MTQKSVSGTDLTQVGVIGLGIMGAGIVEVFSAQGFQVVGIAESKLAVDQGKQNLTNSLTRALAKQKLTQLEVDQIQARVTWSEDFSELADCDLIIEAAPESLALKQTIFKQIDEVAKPSAVLATNTSSLSVTEIAAATNRPSQVLGFHFFNPAPIQKFVELVATPLTTPEVISDALNVGRKLNKYVAQVADQPGFIVNKLLLVYLNHAVQILDLKKATILDIDSAMRELAGYPMGPLELADLIGLDTCVEILKTIYSDSGNHLHKPAAGLTDLLAGGHKGRKTGSGFYNYSPKPEIPASPNTALKNEIYLELETAYLGNAIEMEASGYASKADIDNGMKLGCGLPAGPFERIEVIGINEVRDRQAKLAQTSGHSEYAPLPL
jgi:3-hydroxybutyryl-CoA dehydrogenase